MRIAIVNDMGMAVEVLRRVVTSQAGNEIAWIARDGQEAVEKAAKDSPDLLLMDLMMPVLDGVESTRRIMASSPCPILVVTASVEDHAAEVFAALGNGALDAVSTPVIGTGEGRAAGASTLLMKIRALHRLTSGGVSEESQAPDVGADSVTSVDGQSSVAGRPAFPMVAIGSSAGGPTALATVLRRIPADFPASIVMVQHVDAEFAPGMATWLNDQTKLEVRLAAEGDTPKPGLALLAGGNDHLIVRRSRRLSYSRLPQGLAYRPSVDVFFESVMSHWSGKKIGVLLSGMGRDGAQGLKSLRNAGSRTIAQNKETSVVYGMPKAAAELDAADDILPVEEIADALIQLVG